MLVLENICKQYDGKWLFNNLNLELPSRGLFVVSGKSGIGKSTLLNIIGLLTKPDNGRILFNGKDLNKLTKDQQNMYRSTYIGYVFQEYNLIEELTVYENIELSLRNNFDSNERSERILNVLKKLNIDHLVNKKVKYLSGGERQRVAIGRALVKKSKIILLDEPTSHIDQNNATQFIALLKEIAKDHLIVCSTHKIDQFSNFMDGYVLIHSDGDVEHSLLNDNSEFEVLMENAGYLKISKAAKLGISLFRSSRSKTLSTITLLSIIFTIIILSLNILLYNPLLSYHQFLKDEHYLWGTLVDDNHTPIKWQELMNKGIDKELNNLLLAFTIDYEIALNNQPIKVDTVFILDDNTIDYGDVYLSNFLVEKISKYDHMHQKDVNIIGSTIRINEQELIIQDVYEMFDIDSVKIEDIPSHQYSYLSSIFVNEETFMTLLGEMDAVEIHIIKDFTKFTVEGYSSESQKYYEISILYGTKEITQPNDALLSTSFVSSFFDDFQESTMLIGKSIKLNTSEFNDLSLRIVGIYNDDETTLIISESILEQIFMQQLKQEVVISINTNIEVLKKLEDIGVYVYSGWLSSYLTLRTIYNWLKIACIFLFIIFGFLIYNVFNLFLEQRILSKKRVIGILLTLGIKSKEAKLIFLVDSLLITLVSYFIATGLSIWTLLNFNKLLVILKFNFPNHMFDPRICIILLTFVIVWTILFVQKKLKNLFKSELIDLLRK